MKASTNAAWELSESWWRRVYLVAGSLILLVVVASLPLLLKPADSMAIVAKGTRDNFDLTLQYGQHHDSVDVALEMDLAGIPLPIQYEFWLGSREGHRWTGTIRSATSELREFRHSFWIPVRECMNRELAVAMLRGSSIRVTDGLEATFIVSFPAHAPSDFWDPIQANPLDPPAFGRLLYAYWIGSLLQTNQIIVGTESTPPRRGTEAYPPIPEPDLTHLCSRQFPSPTPASGA